MQQGSPPLQEDAAGRRGLHRVLGVGVAAGPGHSAVRLNRKPKPQAQVRHGSCEDSPSSAREKSVMLQARGPMLEHHIGLGGHGFQARGPMPHLPHMPRLPHVPRLPHMPHFPTPAPLVPHLPHLPHLCPTSPTSAPLAYLPTWRCTLSLAT